MSFPFANHDILICHKGQGQGHGACIHQGHGFMLKQEHHIQPSITSCINAS